MPQVDWNKALIRCSCIGKIMTEGRGSGLTEKQYAELERLQSLPKITDKQSITLADLIARRDAPPKLSDTCTSYLKEVYVYYKYGKQSLGGAQRSQYTIKGRSVEDESIMMLSRYDGFPYTKNTIRFNNDFLTGEPDIIQDEENLKDIKSAWDFATLLSVIDSPLNPDYFWQGQGYMALTGAKHYQVCYCLVSMPQEIIEKERRMIYFKMNPLTEESPDYLKAIEQLEFDMTFDEVPISERIIRFSFDRNDELIQKVYQRVKECRIWLEEFEKRHLGIK